MATVAPHALYSLYDILDPHLSSLRKGGVVGDTSHVKGGGYHISRDDLRRHGQGGDYSIQAPADRRGPGDAASAIDLTLSDSQMKLVTGRLKVAFDRDDDRIECLREFIGTLDGRNVCGWNRYRTGRRTGFYSAGYSESSHLWHVHLSFFRDYCDDQNSILGVAEVVAGLAAGALGWKGDKASTVKVARPAAAAPSGKRPKTYTLVVTKATTGYSKTGKVKHKAGAKGHGAVGQKITGSVGRLSDGRYLVTRWGTWYPLDDNNFEHINGTPVGK